MTGRRAFLFAIALGLTLLGLNGCAALGKSLANIPASFGDFKVTRNIRYATEAPRQQLDVYQPSVAGIARPVVIFLHGGGWRSGSKGAYKFVADALTSRGYVAVLPEYRLFPEVRFPQYVTDAAQAVVWTQQHAKEIGGDPRRIFVMGHSAGAHIGALVVLDAKYLQQAGGNGDGIAGFIGLAGPYEYLPFPTGMFGPPEGYASTQPINFVERNSPPMLLMHGLADKVVWLANTQHMAAKIRSVGGKVEERYYEDMSHGAIIAAFSAFYRNRRPVLNDVERFITEITASDR
jgi:acetyl esterase/lipase